MTGVSLIDECIIRKPYKYWFPNFKLMLGFYPQTQLNSYYKCLSCNKCI